MYFAVDDDTNQLEHHGIKGQRWGVRRFQKEDGTRTAAGKAREQENSDGAHNGGSKINIDKDKLKKGAMIAGAAAAGALLIANPTTRAALVKYGSTAVNKIPQVAGKAAGRIAAKTVNKLEKGAEKAEDAMVNAALAAVGTIAIAKISAKLEPPPDASEGEKTKSKVLTDVASAGLRSMTGGNSGGNGNNSGNGKNVGKEVSDKIGKPSNKGIDKQSAEYQNLFKGQDADTRATIKSLASNGYDIDQINKYLGHSDAEEWINSFIYNPVR